MSDKYPITYRAAKDLYNGTLVVSGVLDRMRAIEIAANGLRNMLREAQDVAYGKPEDHAHFIARLVASDAALAAFATLQPSPHDAPRTA